MKKATILLLVFVAALTTTSLFAATSIINCTKIKCQKAVTKNNVVTKKSVLELARKAAQVSSSQKDVFPDFIIGTTFYKL